MAAIDADRLPLGLWIAALVALINTVRFTMIIPLIYPSYLSIANAIGPATDGLRVRVSDAFPGWITGTLTLLTAALALSLDEWSWATGNPTQKSAHQKSPPTTSGPIREAS